MTDFTEGVNYFKEEPTLVCHNKESVQVSSCFRIAMKRIALLIPCLISSPGFPCYESQRQLCNALV